MGYALWLVPSQEEARSLDELMRIRPPRGEPHLRTRSYPTFHPHITLATFEHLPSSFQLRSIIPQNGPVKTYFRDLKPGSTYLGAMSVQMRKTAGLESLHRSIVAALDVQDIHWKSRNFPHMSLFYVDEAPERERLLQIVNRCASRAEDGRLVLWTGPGRHARPIHRFTGSSVWLVDCRSKDVERWSVLDRLPLARSSLPPARTGDTGAANYQEDAPVLHRRATANQASPSTPRDLHHHFRPPAIENGAVSATSASISMIPHYQYGYYIANTAQSGYIAAGWPAMHVYNYY
ncbi:unnamed protein product [Peniophora sp. CBMAI 1063]|nr:unnamed protein product [Peniophora sp. CBMAI 1063]